MHAPYRVVTDRRGRRCWAPRDAPAVKAAIDESLEHLRAWMPWAHDEPTELPDMVERLQGFRADFDRGDQYVYGIVDRDGEVAGGAGLHRRVGDDALEIGYWIHVTRVRRGLATEAVSALTRVAFDVCGVER